MHTLLHTHSHTNIHVVPHTQHLHSGMSPMLNKQIYYYNSQVSEVTTQSMQSEISLIYHLSHPDTLLCGSNPELSLENAYRQATGIYRETHKAWARKIQRLVCCGISSSSAAGVNTREQPVPSLRSLVLSPAQ